MFGKNKIWIPCYPCIKFNIKSNIFPIFNKVLGGSVYMWTVSQIWEEDISPRSDLPLDTKAVILVSPSCYVDITLTSKKFKFVCTVTVFWAFFFWEHLRKCTSNQVYLCYHLAFSLPYFIAHPFRWRWRCCFFCLFIAFSVYMHTFFSRSQSS